MHRSAFLLPLLMAALPLGAADPPKLDPDLPYQAKRSDPVTYDVDFSAVVTAPAQTKLLKVWLPLPQSDAGQEVEPGEITTFPTGVRPQIAAEKVFGNRFAYFEFPRPEGAQIVRHRFKVTAWQLDWGLDSARVVEVKEWPEGFSRYLRGDRSVVVDDRFRSVLKDIVPQRRGPADDLNAVMAWLNDNMKYDHAAASLRASSEHALAKRAGNCGEYHGLCAAFGRVLGFPTRVVYGIHPFPKNSPSHCKLEAYLPPYGWVSFDVSETQKLIGEINKAGELNEDKKRELARAATGRLRRGFRDNTFILATKGTDYDLAPPAANRAPVVRTIYAEADGVALPDPDPGDPNRREFGWMTAHHYTASKTVPYPFKDWKALEK